MFCAIIRILPNLGNRFRFCCLSMRSVALLTKAGFLLFCFVFFMGINSCFFFVACATFPSSSSSSSTEADQNLVPKSAHQVEETGSEHGGRVGTAQDGQPLSATSHLSVRAQGENRLRSIRLDGHIGRQLRRHQRRRGDEQRRLFSARSAIAFTRLMTAIRLLPPYNFFFN